MPLKHLVRAYRKQALSTQMIWSISMLSLVLLVFIAIAAYDIALEESEEIIDQQMIEMSNFLAEKIVAPHRSVFDPERRYRERDVFIDVIDYPSLGTISQQEDYILPVFTQSQFVIKQTSRGLLKIYVHPTNYSQIQISQPVIVRQNLAQELAFNMLKPYFILMPLGIFIIYWLIRLHLNSLVRLKSAFAQRNYHDLSPIHIQNLPIEIEPAINELNSLFIKIEDAQKKQQAFVANAAHELRTPLTALRLQVDLLLKMQAHQLENDENITDLNLTLRRMTHLVVQLMSLAHQEMHQHEPLTPIDLMECIRSCISQVLMSAREKEIELQVNCLEKNQDLLIQGTPSALESIFINILDNAIKYTPQCGKILVNIKVEQTAIAVEIHDTGPGIPSHKYQEVMQRFVRLEENKNLVFGSGLGLSIVQSALDQVGGSIDLAASEQLQGLKVTLHFCQP